MVLSTKECFAGARKLIAAARRADSPAEQRRCLERLWWWREQGRLARAGLFAGTKTVVEGDLSVRVLEVTRLQCGTFLAIAETADVSKEMCELCARERLPEKWARRWFVLRLPRRSTRAIVMRTMPQFIAGSSAGDRSKPELKEYLETAEWRECRSFTYCQVRRHPGRHGWCVFTWRRVDMLSAEDVLFGPETRGACLSWAMEYDKAQRSRALQERTAQ